jgi:hypothetical protein
VTVICSDCIVVLCEGNRFRSCYDLSRIGKSGISSGEIKFIDIRRKAGGEGNSLGPD